MPTVREKTAYPLPDVIDPRDVRKNGKGYKVVEGMHPKVNKVARVLEVPLDVSTRSKGIRFHEYLHLRYSPVRGPKGILPVYIQAAEDGRVNMIGKNLHAELYAPLLDFTMPPPMELIDDLKAACLCGVASFGMPAMRKMIEDNLSPKIKSEFDEIMSECADIYYVHEPTGSYHVPILLKFNTAKQVAKYLQGRFEKETRHLERSDKLSKTAQEYLAQWNRGIKVAPWGKLKFDEPARPEMMVSHLRRKIIAESYGSVMRYPDRFCTDKQMFYRRTKTHGGTILIDHSGSMNLSQEDVRKVVAAAPFATVASYCGNRTDGVVRILVKNGRRVAEPHLRRPAAGGNIVDYPALRWLCEQKRPLIWVSDGQVSGAYETFAEGNYIQCQLLCEFQGITQVLTVEEAETLLTNIKRGRFKPRQAINRGEFVEEGAKIREAKAGRKSWLP